MTIKLVFEKTHDAEAPNYIYARITGIEYGPHHINYAVDSNTLGYRSFGSDKKAAMTFFEDAIVRDVIDIQSPIKGGGNLVGHCYYCNRERPLNMTQKPLSIEEKLHGGEVKWQVTCLKCGHSWEYQVGGTI